MEERSPMKTNSYALVLAVMLLVILLTNFGVFIAPAISYESVEQERTLCIQDCKARYGIDVNRGGAGRGGGGRGTGVRGGGDSGLWLLYSKCIDDCEKKFWKEWDKNMDEIEKD
jgi:hypothetical protein